MFLYTCSRTKTDYFYNICLTLIYLQTAIDKLYHLSTLLDIDTILFEAMLCLFLRIQQSSLSTLSISCIKVCIWYLLSSQVAMYIYILTTQKYTESSQTFITFHLFNPSGCMNILCIQVLGKPINYATQCLYCIYVFIFRSYPFSYLFLFLQPITNVLLKLKLLYRSLYYI